MLTERCPGLLSTFDTTLYQSRHICSVVRSKEIQFDILLPPLCVVSFVNTLQSAPASSRQYNLVCYSLTNSMTNIQYGGLEVTFGMTACEL